METVGGKALPLATVPTAPAAPTTKTKKQNRPRAVKVEAQNAHYTLVLQAALIVTDILKVHNMTCAVFGSLASKLYGSPRCPKDVDLLVSPVLNDPSDSDSSGTTVLRTLDATELKDLILRANPRNFFLKLPRDPTADYRILWFRQYYRGPECKVDILVPGTMHLPRLIATRVVHLTDAKHGASTTIPVVPFALLLLHKLQGWDDHRKAEEAYKNQKQHQDAADVRKLLALRHESELLKKTPPWDDEELFSEEFRALTKERVKAYCAAFPDRSKEWKALGFEIS
ncbi:hypothetical protein HYPSUDRAFT_168391 [Hypholoma sublateritium FD-334 SS-4]|uniref:Uncharacterized protein n=1 Tax=Hypholoma sublateritium (strain FD-334 SS-4) TaxID=945553 RepID=A0A0D2NR74_HYPSF|nr:hypothetical protein HYPSUDRAFT_168391 [Hypholoma sublateritium FD-334 SS-4]